MIEVITTCWLTLPFWGGMGEATVFLFHHPIADSSCFCAECATNLE